MRCAGTTVPTMDSSSRPDELSFQSLPLALSRFIGWAYDYARPALRGTPAPSTRFKPVDVSAGRNPSGRDIRRSGDVGRAS
jgi:hypothetical protein